MRAALISGIADDVRRHDARRVAIDGVDGAGKTHFADELAEALSSRGCPVIRASVDGFHHPPEVRHRRGRGSPEGYFRDSYDYPRMIEVLLDPLRRGGSGRYVRAVYDVHTESPVQLPPETAAPDAILVLDGIFAHRGELAGFWDYSVFRHVPFEVSIPGRAARGYGHPDPAAECDPRSRATVVIANTDLARPVVTRR